MEICEVGEKSLVFTDGRTERTFVCILDIRTKTWYFSK